MVLAQVFRRFEVELYEWRYVPLDKEDPIRSFGDGNEDAD